jgi:hypothetical protein
VPGRPAMCLSVKMTFGASRRIDIGAHRRHAVPAAVGRDHGIGLIALSPVDDVTEWLATKAWRFCSCAMVILMSAHRIVTTAEALVSGVVPVLTFGTCNGGFQYFVEKVLGLPFLCLGLGLAAAGTLLTRLAEFVAGAPYVE